jgi:molybdopterin adenylyltransferase
MATVKSVNTSKEKGTVKEPVPVITIDNQGIVDDAHRGPWHRQISLLAEEDIACFRAQMERDIDSGEFAENITTDGLDLSRASILDEIRIGSVTLRVTQIGKKCHGDGCAIFREVGKCVMPDKGIFTQVIQPGQVKAGDAVELIERPLMVQIITLSDRVKAGVYPDRSGPAAENVLHAFFKDKRWHLNVTRQVMTDDPQPLQQALEEAIANEVDVILTLGGTGVGPRDNAPQVVASVCDRGMPGIMEFIRNKYGETIPSARLSRSIAGVTNKTQLYALPGSVRAVTQHLEEILLTCEHVISMLYGFDIH